MPKAHRSGWAKRSSLTALIVCALALTACSRHNESEVRTLLERWFALGDRVYFKSAYRCTAAVFELRSDQAKSALRIETEMTRGLRSLSQSGVMALSLEDQSPDEIFMSIMDADRDVGVPVQVAAVLSRDCMDMETQGNFHSALSGGGSLFVWQGAEASLVIMDPVAMVVILASGVN